MVQCAGFHMRPSSTPRRAVDDSAGGQDNWWVMASLQNGRVWDRRRSPLILELLMARFWVRGSGTKGVVRVAGGSSGEMALVALLVG